MNMVKPGLRVVLTNKLKPKRKKSKTDNTRSDLQQLLSDKKLPKCALSRRESIGPEQLAPEGGEVKSRQQEVLNNGVKPNFKRSKTSEKNSSFAQLRIEMKKSKKT
jgi:hypothetical protein